MIAPGYALFDTPLGGCGIAWTERGVSAVSLPPADTPAARRRLSVRAGEAGEAEPPLEVAEAIALIGALMEGGRPDFGAVSLDHSHTPAFEAGVYAIARAIPPGETLTYGDIARRLGDLGLSRAVGQALGRNPWPIIVPCHRVLAAAGGAGGFSAPGGTQTKLRLLTLERAALSPEPLLFEALPLEARPRPAAA